MDNPIHFEFHLEPLWGRVRYIREKVETLLCDYSEELRFASQITVSELLENAVKYGSNAEGKGIGIQLKVTVDERQILITVTNEVLFQEDYEEVRQTIHLINASDDPEELYIQRLL